MGMIKTENIAIMVNNGKEMFYRGVVHSIKEKMEVENEAPGTETLWRTKENLLTISGGDDVKE